MPMIPFIGVRISWLMGPGTRLGRLACSAASLRRRASSKRRAFWIAIAPFGRSSIEVEARPR